MAETSSAERAPLQRALNVLLRSGYMLFSLAIIALGVETYVGTGSLAGTLIQTGRFGRILGPIGAACGLGLLFKRTERTAAMALGALLFVYSLVFEVPHYARKLRSITFRTQVFEPLAIAALAWFLPGPDAIPSWLERAGRYLLALCFIVFGVDHFPALAPIGALIPSWIPWHVFWIAFFGAAFIAAGVSIALNILLRRGPICIGLTYAIWVFTLHLPRTVFGLYGGSGPHAPDEWSNLFIAIALWGGSWVLALNYSLARSSGLNTPRRDSEKGGSNAPSGPI
jgi:hypothetical protein